MTEMIVGAFTAPSKIIDVTLSVDTSAYQDGDLLADAQEITNVFREVNDTGVLQSLTLLDESDQGAAMDLVFTNLATSWGTENAAVGPTDAVAGGILGVIEIATADYVDLANSQIAHKNNLSMTLKSVADSQSVYIAAIARGAGTYGASALKLRLGFFAD